MPAPLPIGCSSYDCQILPDILVRRSPVFFVALATANMKYMSVSCTSVYTETIVMRSYLGSLLTASRAISRFGLLAFSRRSNRIDNDSLEPSVVLKGEPIKSDKITLGSAEDANVSWNSVKIVAAHPECGSHQQNQKSSYPPYFAYFDIKYSKSFKNIKFFLIFTWEISTK